MLAVPKLNPPLDDPAVLFSVEVLPKVNPPVDVLAGEEVDFSVSSDFFSSLGALAPKEKPAAGDELKEKPPELAGEEAGAGELFFSSSSLSFFSVVEDPNENPPAPPPKEKPPPPLLNEEGAAFLAGGEEGGEEAVVSSGDGVFSLAFSVDAEEIGAVANEKPPVPPEAPPNENPDEEEVSAFLGEEESFSVSSFSSGDLLTEPNEKATGAGVVLGD